MAPKTRSGKVVSTVVTKKVVEEIVQIVINSPDEKEIGENRDARIEVVSESIKENEKVEVISSSPSPAKESVKVIIVEDKTEDQEGQQQPQQEQPDKGPEQREEESHETDQETQPASLPEVTPTPRPPKNEEEENKKKRKKGRPKKNTTTEEGRKRSRKKRARVGGGGREEYKRYVFRVMKQVHPDMGISSKAMTIINNLMSDMFQRIADEASKLSRYVGRATLSSIEIQDAVKLVVPGDLGKHAIAEGAKAVTNYAASASTGDNPKSRNSTTKSKS